MSGEISGLVGLKYHMRAPQPFAKDVPAVKCYIHRRNNRTICPTVDSYGATAYWVFLIVDSGSPITYLSPLVNNPPGEMSE